MALGGIKGLKGTKVQFSKKMYCGLVGDLAEYRKVFG